MVNVERIIRLWSQEDVRQQSLPIQQFVQMMDGEIDFYAFSGIFWQPGEGTFAELPDVCVCSREKTSGAPSAYVAEQDVILMAEDFVSDRDESQIVAVLMQELINALAARSAIAAHLS